MQPEHFESLYDLEESYWWFVAMRRITHAIALRNTAHRRLRILDAGCGAGFNLVHYGRQGHDMYGFDVAPEAILRARKRQPDRIVQASVSEIPFETATFDLVFSFDVLEQITIPMALEGLKEMRRVLKPGGFLLVRVPAYEWLRSSHDDSIQTVRRYTLPELQRLLVEAGLRISYATYANTFLFPVVLARRLLKNVGFGGGCDVKPFPAGLRWLDPLFRGILGSEAVLMGARRTLPFGVSAICYAEKP